MTLRGYNKETFYLSRQVQRPSKSRSKLSSEADATASSEEILLEDNDAAALDVTNIQSICYHYNIVYSDSYQVDSYN